MQTVAALLLLPVCATDLDDAAVGALRERVSADKRFALTSTTRRSSAGPAASLACAPPQRRLTRLVPSHIVKLSFRIIKAAVEGRWLGVSVKT